MVYRFDPIYYDGSIFLLNLATEMSRGWSEYERANQPIPASCFPQSLTFDKATAELPDMFHTSRDILVFSEPARLIMEEWAPGQVEFIPVAVHAPPEIAAQLKFASAYYFINVLGRAQRLQWLEMPVQDLPSPGDGITYLACGRISGDWVLRERAVGEPLIWHDTPWRFENREYRGHHVTFIEDVLWRELDANFPGQLNALRIGE